MATEHCQLRSLKHILNVRSSDFKFKDKLPQSNNGNLPTKADFCVQIAFMLGFTEEYCVA